MRRFGGKSGELEQFRTDIRSSLERELKGSLMKRVLRAVGEEMVAVYKDVEMPPKLVENEARSMLQQAVEQARLQGQKAEVPENGHEGYMDAARKRVLVGLAVGEVASSNALRMDPKRLNETPQPIAQHYEEPDQVVEFDRQSTSMN